MENMNAFPTPGEHACGERPYPETWKWLKVKGKFRVQECEWLTACGHNGA